MLLMACQSYLILDETMIFYLDNYSSLFRLSQVAFCREQSYYTKFSVLHTHWQEAQCKWIVDGCQLPEYILLCDLSSSICILKCYANFNLNIIPNNSKNLPVTGLDARLMFSICCLWLIPLYQNIFKLWNIGFSLMQLIFSLTKGHHCSFLQLLFCYGIIHVDLLCKS